MNNIGQYIREIRERNNLTRNDMVEMTGLSLTFFYNLEGEKTDTIKNINRILQILEDIDKIKNTKMKEIENEEITKGTWDILKQRGLDVDINRGVILPITYTYYQQYYDTVRRYVNEFDEEWDLMYYLQKNDANPIIIGHNIALNYTAKLVQMTITYLKRVAERDNIKPNEVQFNKMFLIEWDEILCSELDGEITSTLEKYKPVTVLSEECLRKLREGFERVPFDD